MRKVFTIIKQHSERVENKNFRILGHKPLWRWVLDELSGFDIYVNTDSDQLACELTSKPNVTAIRRTNEHIEWELTAVSRGSPVMDMVKEFCETYLDDNETFALVHVTSPFLKADTLKKAFIEFDSSKCYSVHSVKHIQDALMKIVDGELIPSNFYFDHVKRTQDLEPIYQSLGAFFIMNSGDLKNNEYRRIEARSKLMPLSPLESIEIDNEADFELASLVALALRKDRK